MMNSPLCLGVVTFVGRRGTLPVASLKPLFTADDGELTWEVECTEDVRLEQFPNAGNVSWLHPAPEAVQGSLWEFRVRAQPSYQEHDQRHDRFMVAEHSQKQVYGVIDLRVAGLESDARDLLTVRGISIATGFDPKCWVLCEDRLWMLAAFSPKGTGDERWVLDLDTSGITRWQEWKLDCELHALSEGDLWLLPPGVTPGGPPQQRDWAPDTVVLKRVFQYVRKHDREFVETLGTANRILEKFTDLLSDPMVTEPELQQGRLERARSFLTQLQNSSDRAEAIKVALAESPIADELEQSKTNILEEERKLAKEQAQETLGKLGREIEARKNELKKFDLQLAETRKVQANLANQLEDAILEKVQGAMEKPIDLLSTVAIMRAVMGTNPGPCAAQFAPNKCTIHQTFPRPECKHITSQEEVFKALQKLMLFSDISPLMAGLLHATFFAGAVPLILNQA